MEKLPSHNKDRRSGRRFNMSIPVTVRWTSDSKRMESNALSRDLSSRGLYFHLPSELQNEAQVEIVLTLPSEVSAVGPVKVRCYGRVVRVDQEKEGAGVAVAIERYEFLRRPTTVERTKVAVSA